LTAETKTIIDRLGPVKFVVGPDSVHHLFLSEFHKAYPKAGLFSVEEVIKKKKNENLNWQRYWSDSNREPNFGFENEIKSWQAKQSRCQCCTHWVAAISPASKIKISRFSMLHRRHL